MFRLWLQPGKEKKEGEEMKKMKKSEKKTLSIFLPDLHGALLLFCVPEIISVRSLCNLLSARTLLHRKKKASTM
jgi:hypothetical protein